MTTLPRLFHLQRDHDISGVSGTGRVANGVLWPDGTVALRWIGDRPSTVHWDRLSDAVAIHGHDGATRIVWADEQPPADQAAVLREAADALDESEALRDLTDDHMHDVHAAANELRRLADEAQPAETPGKFCAHCGQPISRVIGTLTAWWVHAPGGNTICDPEQAASSPRATLKPADEAQQDGVQPTKVPPMDPVHILGIEARKANR
ncbi:hypothetical protein AB0A91_33195 [Streptomyces sp. NPDC042207]|uniref:hypothetical protein n=1 Tax=Streptomyces sp. NPDC042207 TaxID=3154331 RepID=UPI0033CACEDB